MGLVTISGEIQAQPLNDNFSYLDEKTENYPIDMRSYVTGDGVASDTDGVQSAFSDAIGRKLVMDEDLNCKVTAQITISGDITLDCRGTFTCTGDQNYWFYASASTTVICENFNAEVTLAFASRTLLNRVLVCVSPTYFEVKTAKIIGPSTAIQCSNGDDFVCGNIILQNVYGTAEQYGYGLNTSAKRFKLLSLDVQNDSTTLDISGNPEHGRHAIYINGSQWTNAEATYVKVENFNKNPVQVVNTNTSAECDFTAIKCEFINCNYSPTASTTGCIHGADENGDGVRISAIYVKVSNIFGPAFSVIGGGNDRAYLGYLDAEELPVAANVATYLVHLRGGNYCHVGTIKCDALNTNWDAALRIRDSSYSTFDNIQLDGSVGTAAVALRDSVDIIIGNIQTPITKISESNTTKKYKQLYQNFTYGSAAPVTGSWTVMDICYDTGPTAGGTVGWVCVTSGTPGTWKAWGNIAT